MEEALTENELLHKRIELLEQKCRLKDSMLEEARALAGVLKELLNDD
ncbi:hypothetical protein B566_EDAN010293 [Ephemera danica]|nr:hypothetical protein B566_EDAN010293 [Ephemera danica]